MNKPLATIGYPWKGFLPVASAATGRDCTLTEAFWQRQTCLKIVTLRGAETVCVSGAEHPDATPGHVMVGCAPVAPIGEEILLSDINPQLIFDVGMHKAGDTDFFLQKGFSVVGVEASPDLCAFVRQKHADDLESGRLVVIERALYTEPDTEITFFLNPDKDDWGSLERNNAEKGIGTAVVITVQTTDLQALVRSYGVPYYAKCDIEGGDTIFVDQLLQLSCKPTFVSVEATRPEDVAKLLVAGYDRFQLVNQYLHPFIKAPNPAREGTYVDAKFTHETSGLFGQELPKHKWTDFNQAMTMFQDWYSLRGRDEDLAIGWLDIHACRASDLAD